MYFTQKIMIGMDQESSCSFSTQCVSLCCGVKQGARKLLMRLVWNASPQEKRDKRCYKGLKDYHTACGKDIQVLSIKSLKQISMCICQVAWGGILPMKILQGYHLGGNLQHYKVHMCELDFCVCGSSSNTLTCVLLK